MRWRQRERSSLKKEPRACPYSQQSPSKRFWSNCDDSDGLGHQDNLPPNDNWIDGPNDLEDVGELVVRPTDVSGLADPHLFLELDSTFLVRVFSDRQAGAGAILGPGLPSEVEIPGALGGHTFGMEGKWSGTTLIHLVLKDGTTEVCRDSVRVSVVEVYVAWQTAAGEFIVEENEYYLSSPSGAPPPDPLLLGVKYHPGATAPGGPWNDVVQVWMLTAPAVEGATIHLKAFDPDDASAHDTGSGDT